MQVIWEWEQFRCGMVTQFHFSVRHLAQEIKLYPHMTRSAWLWSWQWINRGVICMARPLSLEQIIRAFFTWLIKKWCLGSNRKLLSSWWIYSIKSSTRKASLMLLQIPFLEHLMHWMFFLSLTGHQLGWRNYNKDMRMMKKPNFYLLSWLCHGEWQRIFSD